jgi:hypothetical protein
MANRTMNHKLVPTALGHNHKVFFLPHIVVLAICPCSRARSALPATIFCKGAIA